MGGHRQVGQLYHRYPKLADPTQRILFPHMGQQGKKCHLSQFMSQRGWLVTRFTPRGLAFFPRGDHVNKTAVGQAPLHLPDVWFQFSLHQFSIHSTIIGQDEQWPHPGTQIQAASSNQETSPITHFPLQTGANILIPRKFIFCCPGRHRVINKETQRGLTRYKR